MDTYDDIVPAYPDKGVTIFSVMSALAQECNAINLSQGFPDFEIDQDIKDRLCYAAGQGYNQYAPMPGLPALQEAIARKQGHFQNVRISSSEEITITPGATYAIYTALATLLRPGDEVMVLEPAYDSYVPNIHMHGGIPVPVSLNYPDFSVNWDLVEGSISLKTRAIILNNPHNPCGTVLSSEDLQQLEMMCKKHDLYLISDEVYEHIVFDGREHISALRYPGLRERSFVIGSFGKIFHNTGWKVGFCIAPPQLTTAFRKIHQYLAFSVHTPSQHAIASYILDDVEALARHSALLQQKRDLFLDRMASSRFTYVHQSAGSYFQIMDYSAISSLPDAEFAVWLTREHGVASIPLSSFYSKGNAHGRMVRFCFSKLDDTLIRAAENLVQI